MGTASSAFTFIERNVPEVIEQINWQDGMCTGASVYFDTQKHIFRITFKRLFR